MISNFLLSILCCPESRQALVRADAEILARVNARIAPDAAPPLTNRGGEPVRETVSEALVRQDRALLYPVRDGIPILLVEEGIFL
jgi:uncharacterized protein YbaR (Trm112 family)